MDPKHEKPLVTSCHSIVCTWGRRADTGHGQKNLEIEHHFSRTEHTVQVKFLKESCSLDIGRSKTVLFASETRASFE